jgi:hypothetical protein
MLQLLIILALRWLSFMRITINITVLPIWTHIINSWKCPSRNGFLTTMTKTKFVNWTHILDPKSWLENLGLTFEGKEIPNLAKRLQLNERVSIRGLWECLNLKIFSENLVVLKMLWIWYKLQVSVTGDFPNWTLSTLQ